MSQHVDCPLTLVSVLLEQRDGRFRVLLFQHRQCLSEEWFDTEHDARDWLASRLAWGTCHDPR